jgi:tetratricopeptide (TPR) repeat protein
MSPTSHVLPKNKKAHSWLYFLIFLCVVKYTYADTGEQSKPPNSLCSERNQDEEPLPGDQCEFGTKSRAYAQEQSKKIASEARQLVAQHRYVRARALFSLAYAYSPSPETLRPVAYISLSAGYELDAFSLYSRLKDALPHALAATEVEEIIGTLREKTDSQALAMIASRQLRERLDIARHFFQVGLYYQSAEASAIAYSIVPFPRLLFNIAQAYRRNQQPEAAYYFYRRHIEEDPTSPWRKESIGYMCELVGQAFKPDQQSGSGSNSKSRLLWAGIGIAAFGLFGGLTLAAMSNQGQWK